MKRTPEQLEALRIEVALLRGYEWWTCDLSSYIDHSRYGHGLHCADWQPSQPLYTKGKRGDDPYVVALDCPHWPTSLDACRELLADIEARGLHIPFAETLSVRFPDIALIPNTVPAISRKDALVTWAGLTADPEDICEAYIAALKAHKEATDEP